MWLNVSNIQHRTPSPKYLPPGSTPPSSTCDSTCPICSTEHLVQNTYHLGIDLIVHIWLNLSNMQHRTPGPKYLPPGSRHPGPHVTQLAQYAAHISGLRYLPSGSTPPSPHVTQLVQYAVHISGLRYSPPVHTCSTCDSTSPICNTLSLAHTNPMCLSICIVNTLHTTFLSI